MLLCWGHPLHSDTPKGDPPIIASMSLGRSSGGVVLSPSQFETSISFGRLLRFGRVDNAHLWIGRVVRVGCW